MKRRKSAINDIFLYYNYAAETTLATCVTLLQLHSLTFFRKTGG